MRPILLCSLLLLMAGCQAQAVKPSDAATTAQRQADPLAPLTQRFDELLKSNTQVEQRITLMQEQVIKLNQQMQAVQQRNLQLLQAMQQMQMQQQSQQRAKQVSADENEQPAQSQDNELTQILSRVEQQLADQAGGQAAGGYASSVNANGFKLVSAYTPKGQWVIFKYDEATGLSWIATDGSWAEINELEHIPASVYQVILRPAAGDIKGYVAARIDRETGQTWWLKGNSWEPFQ
ncbi:MAG: hypothetical protein OQK12_13755 [Motiliproteus sp.]|nr:hypothetical protein [Motiliproteus sp.]MCW9052547.1 hypothetical protein [Motiliproteus sp.]